MAFNNVSRAVAMSFFLLIPVISFKYSKAQMVPALFVFGDSLVDVGNNNYLPFSIAKADFPNNGIDYPARIPTGRFSNGKVIADFLAEKVGLPTSPPYLSFLSNNNKRPFLTGVNFASGASGILNSTGQSLGMVIPLTKQVDYYASVHKDLLEKLGSSGAQNYLSKSLFAIDTGSNDVLSYSDSSDLREKSTPQQYVGLMIRTLKSQMKRLYIYGARKFLIPGVASVGCAPSRRIENRAGECNEELNALSIKYNEGLKSMLLKLKSKLKDINYSYFDAYSFTQNIIQKPAAYGFSEVKAACCGLGRLNADVPCIPISTYCSNRSNHVFWDIVHPTEATARLVVNTIFDGPSRYSFPINIKQLIAV
ncbi:hypothetical protein P3X46_006617 [Hevea brasiliensis]|uniref:GDSL esterase/lipase At5g55050-like n=1 Tax=Hevea brasiliensis TaxID=3981 RepID=A0ABQ9MQS9_HEVBR|nr:GDSL esterase/lipase At5g55050 isoform X2 [Hevea brasiliensis]KAJ9182647.1 hypothetical protein P3X46_006617 [Hevea brasiliensis]